MGKIYQRTSERHLWSRDAMLQAMAKVRAGAGIRKTAGDHKVPEATLRRYTLKTD